MIYKVIGVVLPWVLFGSLAMGSEKPQSPTNEKRSEMFDKNFKQQTADPGEYALFAAVRSSEITQLMDENCDKNFGHTMTVTAKGFFVATCIQK